MCIKCVAPPILHREFHSLEEETVHGVREEVVETSPEDDPSAYVESAPEDSGLDRGKCFRFEKLNCE